jgi:hypothetical protein
MDTVVPPFQGWCSGRGLPRAAPLASSGLALGYRLSPRWGWVARNGVPEMLGRRSSHPPMPDSRFLPVEPVLCIVALIAIAVFYILYHEGGETEELADDVSVFVGKVRQAAHGPS